MKALQNLRILDLTHMVSGPYAGMILADLGAEMIKVEPPLVGEGTRRWLADDPRHSVRGVGAYFMTLNRNKKSMTLNLKTERGRELFYELVKTADVVLDNFSAGVTERLRISYEHLAAVNPRIITCSITGFGQTGPANDRPAFDMVAQAMGGGMSITGLPDGPPIRAGVPITDLGGGLMGVIGILAAVVAREQTGRGQHVDISMLDTQISLLNYMATVYLLSGEIPARMGNAHFVHVPYDTFPAADGYIILAVITDNFWQNLMGMLDLPELNTEENRTQPGRARNREWITRRLSEVFRTNTQAYWMEQLRKARVPAAPVYDLAQALSDEQVLARQMVVEVPLAEGGHIRAPGNPIKLSETHEDSFTAPPSLGEHSDVILRSLGYTDEEIDSLRSSGII